MAEFTNIELRKARDSRNLPRWKVADEIGISEDTLERWEKGTQTPTPDDVDRLEAIYQVHGMWHAWMRSHYDSYRSRYPAGPDIDATLAIVNVRHQLMDVLGMQDAMERDVIANGRIDNHRMCERYLAEAQEAVTALADMLGKLSITK